MGVSAPIGVTRFSYFAYWVGLFLSGAVFWVSCKISPPDIMYSSSWKELKNHIRPEADGGVVGEGISAEGGEHRDGMEEKEVTQETVLSKD